MSLNIDIYGQRKIFQCFLQKKKEPWKQGDLTISILTTGDGVEAFKEVNPNNPLYSTARLLKSKTSTVIDGILLGYVYDSRTPRLSLTSPPSGQLSTRQ